MLFVLYGVFVTTTCLANGTTDVLASTGIKGEVIGTFGPGSVFMTCVYTAEIVSCLIGYHKTKNPLLFVGAFIAPLFTAAASTYISGK